MKRFFYIIILLASCKDVYNPHIKNVNYNYLVVEGNIVAGNDSTFIRLSRTIPVADSSTVQPELNATVIAEGDGGDTYQLQNTNDGVYFSAPLKINPNENYRLHIFTANGKEYASDFVPVKRTPPIDSVSWKLDKTKGVTIYANTHDATGNSKYYKWDYVETWEHRVPYYSSYIFENDMLLPRKPDEQVYQCWSVVPNSNISIASTTNLSSDVVFEKPLVLVPYGSEQMRIVYSILVKQYALTKEAFEFWENLQKNTERIGSIFDPQPFADFGNLHCISDTSEPVLGYISAATISQQRIYIFRSDLSSWFYNLPLCETDTLHNADELRSTLSGGDFLAISTVGTGSDILAVEADCADCRRHGGSTIKPPYMP